MAEVLRNSGRYTMADQLAYRMKQKPVRMAAATSTVVVSIFYLLAQMVGAGALVALLLGVTSDGIKNLTIFFVGALMIFYVTVGGMKGTTWVQIVKAVLLMAGSALIVVLVLAKFDFNLSDLLGTAAGNSAAGNAFLEHDQHLAGLDPVPVGDPDVEHGAGHRRGDRAVAGVDRVVAEDVRATEHEALPVQHQLGRVELAAIVPMVRHVPDLQDMERAAEEDGENAAQPVIGPAAVQQLVVDGLVD